MASDAALAVAFKKFAGLHEPIHIDYTWTPFNGATTTGFYET